MSAIKPCPHCGHEAALKLYLRKHYIRCGGRDCHIRTEPFDTAEEAIACWNRRTHTEDEYRTLLCEAKRLMGDCLPVNYKTDHEMRVLCRRIEEMNQSD